MSQSGALEGEEFVEFYKALTHRAEVQELFENFSADGQKLTLLEFVDFLREEQKEGEHASDLALELIDHYEPSDNGKRATMEKHQAWGQGGGPRLERCGENSILPISGKAKSIPTFAPCPILFISFNLLLQRRAAISCPDKAGVSNVIDARPCRRKNIP